MLHYLYIFSNIKNLNIHHSNTTEKHYLEKLDKGIINIIQANYGDYCSWDPTKNL